MKKLSALQGLALPQLGRLKNKNQIRAPTFYKMAHFVSSFWPLNYCCGHH